MSKVERELVQCKMVLCPKCKGELFELFHQKKRENPLVVGHVLAKCKNCDRVYDYTVTGFREGLALATGKLDEANGANRFQV